MDLNILIILMLGAGAVGLRFWLRIREVRKEKEKSNKTERYCNKN